LRLQQSNPFSVVAGCYDPAMPTDFSIQRWLEELPDEEIEREMSELNEQIQALSARHHALREALELKQRFRQFYGGTPSSVTEVSSAENDGVVGVPFIPSVTKVHAPELRPSSIGKSVLLVMESSPEKREWTVGDIYSALVDRGWIEDSKQSLRSLGAALSRMKSDGEVRRMSRGLYAPASSDAASPSLLDSEEDASD
jgi:hypothetical protein